MSGMYMQNVHRIGTCYTDYARQRILQFNALSVLEINISPKLKLGNYTEFKSQELQLPD